MYYYIINIIIIIKINIQYVYIFPITRKSVIIVFLKQTKEATTRFDITLTHSGYNKRKKKAGTFF